MGRLIVIMLMVCMLVPVCRAEERVPLTDQKARDSYSLGYEFGSNLKRQEVEVDVNLLLAAVREALEGKKAALGAEEMRATLKQLRQKVLVQYNLRKEEFSSKNKEDGKAFLAANKAKEGVTVLPSGLQYKVLTEGRGPRPKATDDVKVHYRGTLVNGIEFDSSYDRGEPAAIKVNGMIRGWAEAIQLMKTGSKWQLFVPADLAYGERQYGRIPPNSALIFEVELLAIESNSEPKEAAPKPANTTAGEIPEASGGENGI